MRKKWILGFAISVLVFLPARPAAAGEGTYFGNMKRDLGRGLANIVTSPLEIPITVQEYHEKSGRPLIRHTAGFFDGSMQFVERFGSGFWDLFYAFVPGDQEGLPPTPETLF